jgi:cobalt-zinc-cadmium resistance protein CzcA
MRISEMLTGTRGDLAVKIFGPDIDTLNRLSDEVGKVLEGIRGSSEVIVTLNEGINYLSVTPDRLATANAGVSSGELQTFLKASLDGIIVDTLPQGNARIPVMIRLDNEIVHNIDTFSMLEVPLQEKGNVPLSSIAAIGETEGPVQVIRENNERLSVVRSNVEGRDLVGYVDEVKEKIAQQVHLPEGYKIVYGGQFENQQRAAAKLMTVIPISIGVIFLILFFTFRSVSSTTLILLNIPFAVTGGIISLYFSGGYLSVPASVGFIALFGIAVLNGVVMVSYFNTLLGSGYSIDDAVAEGARRRLRPVLMTAFIAALGLLPLLFATGVGSEIQKPLAIVVLGGLVTSTILTLLILPPAFKMIYKRGK